MSLSAPSYASDPGTTSGELLKIPVGARAISMGEAFTALADDSSALYWNPAGMSMLRQKEVSFMGSQLIEGVNYEQMAFVAPGDSYAFGTNLSYLGYGTITGYDNTGSDIPTGNVSAYAYNLNGGISRLITDSLSLGVSGGLLHESLADVSANTFAVNAGALYTLPTHAWDGLYRAGLAVRNLGPGLEFISERDPLPREIALGASAQGIHKLPLNLTADVGIPNDNSTYLSLGSEYWFRDMFAVRLGYAGSNNEGKGLRVGFGLKYGSLLFDYAYAGFGDFGATNRLSLSLRFGEKLRQLNGDERAILKDAKAAEKNGEYVPAILAYEELLDKDPSNNHILHYMIQAHDRMAQAEVGNDVDNAAAIPSPEEAAMSDLVQDVPGPNNSVTTPRTAPDDPLGLTKLPDVSALDVSMYAPLAKNSAQLTTQDSVKAAAEPPAPPPAGIIQGPDTPALTPADIYGN